MIHKSIYSFQALYVQRNKEKVVEAFFFKLLRQGFPGTILMNCQILFTPKHLQKLDLIRASSIHLNLSTIARLRRRNKQDYLVQPTILFKCENKCRQNIFTTY